jgi:hypothetical protein
MPVENWGLPPEPLRLCIKVKFAKRLTALGQSCSPQALAASAVPPILAVNAAAFESQLRFRVGRSLRSSRTPASPQRADIQSGDVKMIEIDTTCCP